jgi:hypothetical protein
VKHSRPVLVTVYGTGILPQMESAMKENGKTRAENLKDARAWVKEMNLGELLIEETNSKIFHGWYNQAVQEELKRRESQR